MDLFVSYYSFDEVTKVSLDTVTPSRTPPPILIASQFSVHIIETGGFLYLLRDPGPGAPLVDKINPLTLTVVDTLVLTMADSLGTVGPNMNLATDGTYLYVSADRPFADQGRIIRIDLATFLEVDFIVDALRTPILTMDENNNLYVGHWFDNEVYRIPAGTFAVDSTLNMTVLASTQAMHCKGNFLYICQGLNGNDRAVQINLTTFAEVTNINFVAEPWGWGMASDDTYLYVGLADAPGDPGRIVRCTLNPFARVDSITLPAGENDPWSPLVDGAFLYALCESNPTSVVKIDRATFTRVNGLTFPAGVGDAWSGVMYAPPVIPPSIRKPEVATLAATEVT